MAKEAKRKAVAKEAAAATEKAKQRYAFLKEKQTAQGQPGSKGVSQGSGQLHGAESKELRKLQNAMDHKRRREEESPEDKEARLKKMRKVGSVFKPKTKRRIVNPPFLFFLQQIILIE